MKLYHVIALSMLALFMSGCVSSDSKSPLVVDVAVVAKALGSNEAINGQLSSAEKKLNQQLNKIAADLNVQIKDKQKALTKKSSKKARQEVEQFEKQAQQTMRNKKLEAQNKINQLKASLLSKFRDDVKAVAEPIAKAAGSEMVVLVTPSTLWFDPHIDITDEVIARMRATE